MSQPHMNAQLSSKLLSLPLEIRQEIFTYLIPNGAHASFQRDQLVLSECVQSAPNAYYAGNERKPYPHPDTAGADHYIYAHRLRTSWGPHWQCEELLRKQNGDCVKIRATSHPMFRVCKKACEDMLNCLMDLSMVHITDLDVLQRILSFKPGTSRPQSLSDMALFSMTRVHNLTLTLRLSLKTFRTMSRYVKGINHGFAAYKDAAFLRICDSLQHLPRLRTLSIWADHTHEAPWAAVNERTFLSALSRVCFMKPHIRTAVNLPKLHPCYESPLRHFLRGQPRPPFTLQRRVRQSWRAAKSTDNRYHISCYKDFPVLYHSVPITLHNPVITLPLDVTWYGKLSFGRTSRIGRLEHFDSDEEYLEAIESFERNLWERGARRLDVGDLVFTTDPVSLRTYCEYPELAQLSDTEDDEDAKRMRERKTRSEQRRKAIKKYEAKQAHDWTLERKFW